MDNNTKQFYNPDDECIYFYDEKKERYRKICDIPSFAELPFIIRQQIIAVKKEAKRYIAMPTTDE